MTNASHDEAGASTAPAPVTLDYGITTRVSRTARAAMILAIIAIPLFFTVLPAVTALIVAFIAAHRIRKDPQRLAGLGFIKTANILGVLSILLFCAGLALLGAFERPRVGHNRSYCSANLRGIVQSMNIYAADYNDAFPVVPFAPYSPALNNLTATAVSPDAETTIKSLFDPASPLHGSPTAGLWILVLRNQVSAKQFICRSDIWAGPSSAPRQDSSGNFYNHFQSPNQLSYSVAYPWRADGTVGKWWTALFDDKLPTMSDMAPEQGTAPPDPTGSPARVLNPATTPRDAWSWLSANHNNSKPQRPGMNVVFSDGHVEWVRTPTVGHDNDNIFTFSDIISRGPREFGGLFINKTPIHLNPPLAPPHKFDTVMVPIRNESTGKL